MKVHLGNNSMKVILERWESFLNEMASFTRVKRKIDEENMEFIAISAFRTYRSSRKNHGHDKRMKTYLDNLGFSYTKTLGGYAEPVIDTETGKEVTATDPETGEEKTVTLPAVERSIIVTREERPDRRMAENTPSLFNIGMIISKNHDQIAFIHGGLNEMINPKTDEKEQTMFIASYNRDGDRIKEPWAGPWSTIEKAAKDDVYWTKIAGTKGKFVESYYRKKLSEAKKIKVESGLDALKRKYYIDRYKSALENK